jgi:hypothetical protein
MGAPAEGSVQGVNFVGAEKAPSWDGEDSGAPAAAASTIITSTNLISQPQLAGLLQRFTSLETENAGLREECERLSESLESCKLAEDMDKEILAVLEKKVKPTGGKTYELLQAQKLNMQLVEEIKGAF